MKVILKTKIDEDLEKIWKNLEEKNKLMIFKTLKWNRAWIKINNLEKNIKIFIINVNNETVGIFPFYEKKIFKSKIIQWIGFDTSDYLGPIIDANFKPTQVEFNNLWKNILDQLKNETDLILLDKLINKSFTFLNPLTEYLYCQKYDTTYGINLKEWENILLRKNRSLQKIRWSKRKLESLGKIEFVESLEDLKEKKKIIDQLILWKKESKKNYRFLKSFSGSFYLNFINSDDVQISGLKLNNNYIALSFGLKFDDNYFYLVPSYKSEKNIIRYSPGKILMIELINFFHKKKFKYFDFCNGNEKYKQEWSDNKIDVKVYIESLSIKGFFLKLFYKLRYIKL